MTTDCLKSLVQRNRHIHLIELALAAACLSSSGLAGAASFPCDGNLGVIETAICSNDDLSQKDEQMVELYQGLLNTLPEADAAILKRDQIEWLHETRQRCRESKDLSSRQQCLNAYYRSRIEGLRNLEMEPFPALSTIKRLCDRIASDRLTDISIVGVQEGQIDIDNDGELERALTCHGGSMGSDCVDYRNLNDQRLFIERLYSPVIFMAHGKRPFRYQGDSYTLYAYDDDFLEPAFVSYTTPAHQEHVMCEFTTDKVPVYTPGSEPVCKTMTEHIAVGTDLVKPFTTERARDSALDVSHLDETWVRGFGQLDFNNDGVEESIVELEYSSGRGRGCDVRYIDAVDSSGQSFRPKAERQALLEAQSVLRDTESFELRPRCTIADNGYVRFDDRVYLSQKDQTSGALILIEGDDVQTQCTLNYDYHTTVKAINAAGTSPEGRGP